MWYGSRIYLNHCIIQFLPGGDAENKGNLILAMTGIGRYGWIVPSLYYAFATRRDSFISADHGNGVYYVIAFGIAQTA